VFAFGLPAGFLTPALVFFVLGFSAFSALSAFLVAVFLGAAVLVVVAGF
jgi:hypothetical protein